MSAILPLIVVPQSNSWIGIVVGIGSWLVPFADYVVQARFLPRYARSRLGRVDLEVVIATVPWFLLPFASAGGFAVVLRVIRLVRLARPGRGTPRLVERLGRVFVVAGGVLVVSCLVAYHAEHPTNPGSPRSATPCDAGAGRRGVGPAPPGGGADRTAGGGSPGPHSAGVRGWRGPSCAGSVTAAAISSSGSSPCWTANIAAVALLEAPIFA